MIYEFVLSAETENEVEMEPWITKILNDAILKEAKRLRYKRIYLKSTLVNYYEKFGAKLIKNIDSEEKLYYIDV